MIIYQVLMAHSVRTLYWYCRTFLILMMWSKVQFSYFYLLLYLLKAIVFPLLQGLERPTMAGVISLIINSLHFNCFFFMALYFLQKTTSGIIYSDPFSSIFIIKNQDSLLWTLNLIELFSDAYLSVEEPLIHLFIYPAITTSYHFFYSQFIYRFLLKHSILLTLMSQFGFYYTQDLKNLDFQNYFLFLYRQLSLLSFLLDVSGKYFRDFSVFLRSIYST